MIYASALQYFVFYSIPTVCKCTIASSREEKENMMKNSKYMQGEKRKKHTTNSLHCDKTFQGTQE